MKKWTKRQDGDNMPTFYLTKECSPEWFGVVVPINRKYGYRIGLRVTDGMPNPDRFVSPITWKSSATAKSKALWAIKNKRMGIW